MVTSRGKELDKNCIVGVLFYIDFGSNVKYVSTILCEMWNDAGVSILYVFSLRREENEIENQPVFAETI